MLDEAKKAELPEVKFTTSFLETEFKRFNKLYFNGKLKPITLTWSSHLKALGRCVAQFNTVKQQIITLEIILNRNELTDYAAFRNTFVHEMCHYFHNASITKEQIKAANKVGYAMSRKWCNALGWGTDGLGHSGVWEAKANELNKKFKELHIQRIGGKNAVANRTATGRIKKSAIKAAEGNHAVMITRWKTYFTFLNDAELKAAKKDSLVKEIYEFEYDPTKVAEYGLKVCSAYTRGYKQKFFTYLCKEGVIKKYTKKQIK